MVKRTFLSIVFIFLISANLTSANNLEKPELPEGWMEAYVPIQGMQYYLDVDSESDPPASLSDAVTSFSFHFDDTQVKDKIKFYYYNNGVYYQIEPGQKRNLYAMDFEFYSKGFSGFRPTLRDKDGKYLPVQYTPGYIYIQSSLIDTDRIKAHYIHATTRVERDNFKKIAWLTLKTNIKNLTEFNEWLSNFGEMPTSEKIFNLISDTRIQNKKSLLFEIAGYDAYKVFLNGNQIDGQIVIPSKKEFKTKFSIGYYTYYDYILEGENILRLEGIDGGKTDTKEYTLIFHENENMMTDPGAIIGAEPEEFILDYPYISEKFPFSLPWDFMRIIGIFDVQPVAPVIEVKRDNFFEIAGKKMKLDFTIDFSNFDALAKIIRFFILIIFDIGLIFSFRRLVDV